MLADSVILISLASVFLFGWMLGALYIKIRLQRTYDRALIEAESKLNSTRSATELFKSQAVERENAIYELQERLRAESQEKTAAQTALISAEENIREQRMLLESSKKELTDAFASLSSRALRNNNEEFLNLAKESFEKIATDTKGKFGEHQAKIDSIVRPLHEALRKYEEEFQRVEEKRREDFGGIESSLKAVNDTHTLLRKETANLVNALKRPQVRGRWGEMQLRRTVELAGMTEYCDFTEQVSINTDHGRQRPDLIVHLPVERDIVVDAKVSLDAYLRAFETSDEEEKNLFLKKHSQQIREHMGRLGQKAYWEQFAKSPEFVVLFLPGESFLSAALDRDVTILEDGFKKRVIIATPTTLIALLRAVAFGWRQEQMTRNAEEISRAAKELYSRINIFIKHLSELGMSINKSVSSFNKTIGSMDSRVLPTVRRFKDLGVRSAEEINPVEPISITAREAVFAEVQDSLEEKLLDPQLDNERR